MKKLFTLALVLVASVSTMFAAEFPEINIADLKQAITGKKVAIIDICGPDSFKQGHIPGAIDYFKYVPGAIDLWKAQDSNIASVLPANKDALVVVYGASPTDNRGRVRSFCSKVSELGYTNVKLLSDGIYNWKNAGGAMEK